MKRLILSAVTASMLAASAFSGQAAPQSNYTQIDWQKPGRHVDKRFIVKKKVVKRRHWRSGQRYSNWKRHQP
ncbi:MAG: hypothetical protein E5W02_19965, partial [Mesorhizobium sp.]